MRLPVLACALSCFVGSAVSLPAQTAFLNTNYGLLPDEMQYLYASNPAPQPFYSFYYDIKGPINLTTPALLSGMAYQVRISGRAGVGPLDGFMNYNNSRPDAAFDYCGFFENLDTCQRPGNGVGVTTWDGVDGRRPAVDAYNPNHVYDYFIAGKNAGLRFTFSDNPYGDNYSDMQVEISSLGSMTNPSLVPEPSAGALVITGLAGIFVAARIRRRPRC
jgi:hypothetical protein